MSRHVYTHVHENTFLNFPLLLVFMSGLLYPTGYRQISKIILSNDMQKQVYGRRAEQQHLIQ